MHFQSVTLIFILITSNSVASRLDPLIRQEGENVLFMFNTSTNILSVSWGIGSTNGKPEPVLIAVEAPSVVQLGPNLNSTGYAGRVRFVGTLSKGQAWFKITNLNINDTNQYMVRIYTQGAPGSPYTTSTAELTVTPKSTTTTVPSVTSLKPTGITIITQESTTVPPTNPPILKNLTTTLKVNREFSQALADSTSLAFRNFSSEFQAAIESAYTSMKEEKFENVKVIHLREGSILVTFIVFFKTEIMKDEACSPIEKAIKNGKLGTFEIAPGSLGCLNERPSSPRPPGARTGVHPGIIAGVAIVGVLAIAGLVITIIYVCRKKSSKKAYRSSSGQGNEMQTQHGEPEEQYASVQRPGATGATQSHDHPLPQYAAVDKSKKKKKPKDPNELIYAQLDHDYNTSMGTRPPSDRRPTSGSDTVYADIQSDKQKQRHPPPQYGNMQDISHA